MNPLGRCAICSREVPTLDRGVTVPHNDPDTAVLCKGSNRFPVAVKPAPSKPVGPEWYTVAEVADLLRVSRMTAYRLANTGELPSHRIGRSMRIHRDNLAGYMRGAEIRP